jgi:hypothetical protein
MLGNKTTDFCGAYIKCRDLVASCHPLYSSLPLGNVLPLTFGSPAAIY